MMSVQEIETAIQQFSDKEVNELSVWLADYRASLWDEQIARDLDAGRLDDIAAEVDGEYEAEKAKPL
jgi:hypothetical protein